MGKPSTAALEIAVREYDPAPNAQKRVEHRPLYVTPVPGRHGMSGEHTHDPP